MILALATLVVVTVLLTESPLHASEFRFTRSRTDLIRRISSQSATELFKYQKTHIDSELLDVVVMKNEGLW